MLLWTNRKEAHYRLSSARLLDLVKTQSESQEKTGSTLLSKGSSVDLLRLFLRQRNQAGIGVFWRETSCPWAGWKTSSPARDMGHGSRLSSCGVETWPQSASELADSWKFTAQWTAEPTAQLLCFWGRWLVIVDWIHQRQHDGSPHPPLRGESPNECKDISVSSKLEVCSAWTASFIGSF